MSFITDNAARRSAPSGVRFRSETNTNEARSTNDTTLTSVLSDYHETRQLRERTAAECREVLHRIERKIRKAAGLEEELLNRAMLLREKRRRLVMGRSFLIDQVRDVRGGAAA